MWLDNQRFPHNISKAETSSFSGAAASINSMTERLTRRGLKHWLFIPISRSDK
jgi:hypothetical protein